MIVKVVAGFVYVQKCSYDTRFIGKNLTIAGEMGLFYSFIRALGVEEALERVSIGAAMTSVQLD